MHPNRKFRWTDRQEMFDFISSTAFGQVFLSSAKGPAVCHVPLLVREGTLWFHVARSNLVAQEADGAIALASVLGSHGYVSPDWYGVPDQVPTWNYLVVEAVGPVRALLAEELVELVDELSATHEARLAPKAVWTRAKMKIGSFEGMLKSIIGFELNVKELRGTRKLGQNKSIDVIINAAYHLGATGNSELAEAMRVDAARRACCRQGRADKLNK